MLFRSVRQALFRCGFKDIDNTCKFPVNRKSEKNVRAFLENNQPGQLNCCDYFRSLFFPDLQPKNADIFRLFPLKTAG